MMKLSERIPHKIGCACTLQEGHECNCYVGKVAHLEAEVERLRVMADHVHEWKAYARKLDAAVHYCQCECGERLTTPQIEAMLNAAEQLSAEIVNGLLEGDDAPNLLIYERVALRAYAKARGGE
jgi:hypothetical protein